MNGPATATSIRALLLALVCAPLLSATTCTPHCPRPAYRDWFEQHPAVAALTIDVFDVETRAAFCAFTLDLAVLRTLSVAEPEALQSCVEPAYCPTVALTHEEVREIRAARAALAIWLDLQDVLPWKLADYSEAELAMLFDPDELFDPVSGGHGFFSVVDHSPAEVYAFLEANDLIGPDLPSTVERILDEVRTTDAETNFLHGIAAWDPVDTAYTAWEALAVPAERGRISRRGCHSMTRILLAMLRSVNIPGYETRAGLWFGGGHSTAVLEATRQVVPHGDDIYSATLRAAPSAGFLPDFDFYGDPAHTAVCGSAGPCLSRRHRALLALAHPDNWTTRRCCDPGQYGYASCEDYLTASYASVLTAGEIAAGAAAVEAGCP